MSGKEEAKNWEATDWELGYAMTIHTSQGMTLKAPQRVWVIDENLAWDNLIYLAVGRVEYLSQLIRVEAPPLPPEIAQEIGEAKKKRRLEHKLRLSIQEKLIGYMYQDKKKDREFDLSVDYILMLNNIQEGKCALCLIEMKWEWDKPGDILQWTVDRIQNSLGISKEMYISLVLNAIEIIESKSLTRTGIMAVIQKSMCRHYLLYIFSAG